MSEQSEMMWAISDIFASVSGDMHTIHLNLVGAEFDELHKHVFKEYYEELDEDYDSAAEWGRCYGEFAENKNESAMRLQYQSLEPKPITKDEAVQIASAKLELMLRQMHMVYKVMNEGDDALSVGIANWLQTRLEFWSKETLFFNKARAAIGV